MPFPFSSSRIRGIRHFGLISRVLIKHGMGEIADRMRGRTSTRIKSGLPMLIILEVDDLWVHANVISDENPQRSTRNDIACF